MRGLKINRDCIKRRIMYVLSLLLVFVSMISCTDRSPYIEASFNFDKAYPKVFQAWSEADNMQGFTDVEEMAAYDLVFDSVYAMGLQWDISKEQPYAMLSTKLVDEETGDATLQKAINYKEDILDLNQNFKILAEIHIREEYYVTDEEIASGLEYWEYEGYPLDSEFWLLDEEGKHIPAWGEDLDGDGIMEEEEAVTYLVDFTNDDFQELLVKKVVALYESGVFDGVFFDWWSEEHHTLVNYDYTENYMTLEDEIEARVALLEKIREKVPDDFLILVNVNYDKIPRSAPYVNGVYMECYKDIDDKGISDQSIDKIEETLSWAEENMLEPRINCVETWRDVTDYNGDQNVRMEERVSYENIKQMGMLTALVCTISDGHVLFSDNNALPTWDHQHNYYPLWTKDFGEPLGEGEWIEEHVYVRTFENVRVIYNGSSSEVIYGGHAVEAYSGYFDFY